MKKILQSILLMVIVIVLGCNENSGVNPPRKNVDISTTEQHILNSNNQFGFQLLRTIAETSSHENTVISPISISMALGMTLNGAAGTTYDSMKTVLGFQDFTSAEINQSYRHLIDLLMALDPEVVMEIANSIWIREGVPVNSTFKEVNQANFDAEIRTLDFSLPSTVDDINSWVANKTHDRIKRIIQEIEPSAVMYLINALYFKGTWAYEFKKSETHEAQFQMSNNSAMDVDMMMQENDYQYFANDEMQVVDLPYGDGDFSMTLLLPSGNHTLNDIVQSLDSESWNTLIASLNEQEGTVYLPKFELKCNAVLNSPLTDLGMGIAFHYSRADFSAITTELDLFINEVLHKTYIRVDESGTEAAAVTSVGVGITSIGGDDHFVMRIDHPFLLTIRERTSGAILFLGIIEQPERIES